MHTDLCVFVALCFSLREAQEMLTRKALVRAVGGNKIAHILLKQIEAERNRLQSCNCTEEKTGTKAFYTQHGQYKLIYTPGQCAFFSTHTPSPQTISKHQSPLFFIYLLIYLRVFLHHYIFNKIILNIVLPYSLYTFELTQRRPGVYACCLTPFIKVV